ncbi:hypothetical protein SKAU_G00111670 [Synaphobranchus kaupii]|uniref:UBZ2-type domain-containing protein n=1 Tax=Synaphobranchus kaupii TaxID=118154 RepID=A0A9Q1G0C1_SYNKA|nr:hypothetical protein SKAU_G00111670 [Synaphobranchus kaupii]
MSEKHLKLKLKRKKSSIQGDKCEQHSSITVKKSTEIPIPLESERFRFESELRSETTGDPYDSKPGVWWERLDLQPVEKLWAVTLKAATPYLGHGVWEMVPDLPLVSPVTRSVEEESEWKWCSLREEVGPLPPPPKPPGGSLAVLDAPGPSLHFHPTDARPVSGGVETPPSRNTQKPDPAHRKGHLSCSPTQEKTGEGTPVRNPSSLVRRLEDTMGRRPQNPPSSRKVVVAGAGRGEGADGPRPSSGRAREEDSAAAAGRASLAGAGSGGTEGGVIKRRLGARAGAGSDSWAPAEEQRRAKSPAKEGDESADARTLRNSAGGAAGTAAMENCPMCLLPFPSGFTQMECDSHLAKCLSEMSEDIAW